MPVFAVTTARDTGWDHTRDIREQPLWDQHAAFADELVNRGIIILGGPIGGGDGEDLALLAVEATDEDAVRSAFAAERVTFAHAGGLPLFTGLDLAVPAGAKVGLVGRSGGGKTTLTRLLLRMMDVAGGRILIGGQDISRLRQSDLRSLIAYVPQDPAMFHRTLRDNIAFARRHATDAEIRQAAQAAHVTELADMLPDGFDTMVGERGVKLSGGQRQRVALARAILRDAPILLLDEATSALDSESETLVQQALWQLMQDRTALVVAHRLSTVARMDQLVVLDHGQIIEQGTHEELLRRIGTYARLWQHQSGGFLDDDETTAMPAGALTQAM